MSYRIATSIMATHRENKDLHEVAVLDAAVEAHNHQTGSHFGIVSRPDPPDAIIEDGECRLWVEHTDVYYSDSWATDLNTFAASDKRHIQFPSGLHMSMDAIFAKAFYRQVLQKYRNRSYAPLVRDYGPGILIVGLETPWLSDDTIDAINDRWEREGSPDVSSVFRWIYIGFRNHNENMAIPWAPQRRSAICST